MGRFKQKNGAFADVKWFSGGYMFYLMCVCNEKEYECFVSESDRPIRRVDGLA